MRVGLIGLGRMGAAMAARLAGFGLTPIAWDISANAREAAIVKGITVVENPRAVAQGADVVITSITEDSGVRGLFAGAGGFLGANLQGKLFIEMSTLRPETVREISARLTPLGAAIVDSPVLGSIPTVVEGKLLSLAGGEAAHIDRARPVLEKLTRAIVHMGPAGSGHAMKLAVNLVMANYLQAMAEALALGGQNGLQMEQMLEVFASSPLANGILNNKLPQWRGGPVAMTLDMRTLRKDAQSALATGTAAGLSMPATAGALDALAGAIAAGWGERDIGEIVGFMNEKSRQQWQ